MLKFLRKYKQILLVVAGVLLMVAFLLPQAIREIASERANVVVMKIGQRKITALQHHEMTMEYELLNRLSGGTLPLMGISEGPEQWILLCELAQRGGYIGAAAGNDILDDVGRIRALTRLRMQWGEQSLNMLMSNPQLAGVLQGEIQRDVEGIKEASPRLAAELRMTEQQAETTLAKFTGVQRLIRAYSAAARVSTPRAILRAERELEGAQVEYIVIPADRQLPNVPQPDDAALQAFMEQYKDVKPGEGEYGIGYLLPARVKLEYLVLDAKKIGDKVVPDLKEIMRRFKALPDKTKTLDESRAGIEQQIRREMVERVMSAAQETVRSHVSRATLKLPEDGQFKILPGDWAAKRPTLASMVADIVTHVEEKTRPEPGKPGLRIDPPTVVVKDASFLTAEDLGALESIGGSFLQRGQRQVPFADYALAVHELQKDTPLSLQVGLPCDEPTHDGAGSTFFFTVLDTRPESTPKSIDEVREKLVADWKKVQAYKLLADQDAIALRQKAVAEGINSLDDSAKTPPEPGKPPKPSAVKTTRVTRTAVSNADPGVNVDTFRLAVVEAAEKLDPLTSADKYTPEQRTLVVKLPQKLGVVVARIKSLVPLTVEDFRGQQNRLVNQFQLDEFRALKSNPFTLDRLRTRLNVKNMSEDSAKRQAAANAGG